MIQLPLPMRVAPPPSSVPRLIVTNSRIRLSIADHEQTLLALIFLVLRVAADRGELGDAVVAADARRPLDHHMRPDLRTRADLDVGADHAVGADADVGADFGGFVDRRPWGEFPYRSSCGALRAHASRLRRPACRRPSRGRGRLPMLRIMRLSSTSSTSWSPGTTILRELGLVDLDEEVERMRIRGVVVGQVHEHARRLRERFDDQHAGHHRIARESGPGKTVR